MIIYVDHALFWNVTLLMKFRPNDNAITLKSVDQCESQPKPPAWVPGRPQTSQCGSYQSPLPGTSDPLIIIVLS